MAAAVQRAVEHMNDDHRDSLLEMAQAIAGYPWATDAELVAVDTLGVNVRASGDGREGMARIAFDAPLAGHAASWRGRHGALAGGVSNMVRGLSGWSVVLAATIL